MSQIATLVTGAGVNTTVSGQSQLENNMVIGDIDTAMPLTGLKVVLGGRTTIDIQGSTPLVSFFAKFMQRISGTVVGLILKIGSGRLIKEGSSVIFTNGGATTPAIFSYSDKGNGIPINAVTQGINALSNQTFSNFAGLGITPSANVGSFDVLFTDGTSQNMSVIEADAYFASKNDTEANGRFDAVVTGFDNRDRSIESVRVNATTALSVLVIS